VLDENGMVMHDMTGASIITPTLGVGISHDVLNNSENFGNWTTIGTASVTSNNRVAPDGITQSADTLAAPAVNDGIYQASISAVTLTVGQSAVFSVWMKAASAGTIHLQARAYGTATVLGEGDVAVETMWRRVNLVFSNTTGGATRVTIRILRTDSSQLSTVYLWGAQLSFGVDRPVPYWPMNLLETGLQPGVFVRGVLGIASSLPSASIAIGSSWSTVPTGSHTIAIGHSAGNASTGDYGIALGSAAGQSSSATGYIAIGRSASANYDYSMAIGRSATATAANQIVLGSNGYPYYDLYAGAGVTASSPATFTSHATGGSGTNIAGGALKLAGGQGTGSGAGGSVIIQTAPAGGSGSGANALVDRVTITSAGLVGINTTPSGAQLHQVNSDAAQIGYLFTAHASQSVDMAAWYKGGVKKVYIRNDGVFGFSTRFLVRNAADSVDCGEFYNVGSGGAYDVTMNIRQSTGYFGIAVGGTPLARFAAPSGESGLMVNRTSLGGGAVTVSTFDAGSKGFVAFGSASQTGDLYQGRDSGNTALWAVTALGGMVVNESGADADTRIEGDTDVNLTFWDASTDRVGIGTATPGYKLDVAGGVNVSSGNVYRVAGKQVVAAQQAAIANTTNSADVGVQLNKVIAAMRAHGLIAT
jgi:hypothetical protein